MESKFDCWVFVPGTEKRFAVSNLGHFMKVARKKRRGNKMVLEACLELMPVIADYKSGALGWYAWYDNDNHFFEREKLMFLFPKELVELDRSNDDDALRLREETLREDIS